MNDAIRPATPPPWAAPDWHASAVQWIDARLSDAGIARTSEVEQRRLRPWSAILTAKTTSGEVWFKANGPGTAFEARLYALLQGVTPESVLHPLGVDTSRGWLLLPEGRPLVGAAHSEDDIVESLTWVFPQYAEFQLRLSSRADELVALGIADMRPPTLPRRLEQAIDYVSAYVARRGSREDRERIDRVRLARPQLLEWFERLAAAPGGASLDHNDLHPHNVFTTEAGGKELAQFYDFGDAVVAHPFASMLIGLGFLTRHLKVPVDDPRIHRVRDAYLEPFGALAPRAELIETMELAARAGQVARSLVWARAVEGGDEDGAHANHGAPMECLFGVLSRSYLAGGT